MTPVSATNGQTETPEITTVRQFLAGIENHDLESHTGFRCVMSADVAPLAHDAQEP